MLHRAQVFNSTDCKFFWLPFCSKRYHLTCFGDLFTELRLPNINFPHLSREDFTRFISDHSVKLVGASLTPPTGCLWSTVLCSFSLSAKRLFEVVRAWGHDLTHKINNNGPDTDTCGQPSMVPFSSEYYHFITDFCCEWIRNFIMLFMVLPVIIFCLDDAYQSIECFSEVKMRNVNSSRTVQSKREITQRFQLLNCG